MVLKTADHFAAHLHKAQCNVRSQWLNLTVLFVMLLIFSLSSTLLMQQQKIDIIVEEPTTLFKNSITRKLRSPCTNFLNHPEHFHLLRRVFFTHHLENCVTGHVKMPTHQRATAPIFLKLFSKTFETKKHVQHHQFDKINTPHFVNFLVMFSVS